MKKNTHFFICTVAVLVLLSCSAKKASTAASPSASQWRSAVKGQWMLESIEKSNFPKGFNVKTVFEEAPAECFAESNWNLMGNGKGSITFSASGQLCAPGAVRDIFWSVYNPGKGNGEPQFQFKKIYPGDKAKNVTEGYRLDLIYADEQKMTMRMPLSVDGQTAYLVLNFKK
ncbi:hypothetical protein SAMN05216436_104118 [bacterium A37T11]|nr:hypothetical protein SAMN05216436_104118 [bacterium A37T11]